MTATTRLKRVATLRAGGTPTVDDPSMWRDDGLPWVSISDMTKSPVVLSTDRRVSQEGIASKRLHVGRPGTTLFAMYASVGAIGVLGVEASWNQALLGIEPRPGLADARFIRYWLEHLRPDLAALTRSNTQDNLNAEQVGNFPFPTTSVETQRAIADYLDTETTRIDALITKKRRMIRLLDERENSLIDEVFGLGDERLVRLGRVARLQTGLTLDSNRTFHGESVTAPYLRVANVQPGWLNLNEVKDVTVPKAVASRCLLLTGDVLMTEGGDLDKLGRGTVWRGEISGCLHQNHVFAVRPYPRLLLPDYLAMFTRTSYARRYFESTGTRSTNLASTNSSKVLDLHLPVLPVEEQRSRLHEYGTAATSIDQCRQRLTKQIDLLVEHRQALTTAAVTGELSVPGVAA